MAVVAFCFSFVYRREGFSAKKIFFLSNRLKMQRVDAVTDSAEMVYLEAIGNWAFEKFI